MDRGGPSGMGAKSQVRGEVAQRYGAESLDFSHGFQIGKWFTVRMILEKNLPICNDFSRTSRPNSRETSQ